MKDIRMKLKENQIKNLDLIQFKKELDEYLEKNINKDRLPNSNHDDYCKVKEKII